MYGDVLRFKKGVIDFGPGCVIMGILNVTPDSFSDGGCFLDKEKAVDHALAMAEDGAEIIDIGPESSRPGAEPVSVDTQIERCVDVIAKIKKQSNVVISIDTRRWEVAKAALEVGADIVNDITGMNDQKMREVAADHRAGVVLMHMKGDPLNMQKNPEYKDVVSEVRDYLVKQAKLTIQAGVSEERIFIDPGIGFGKTTHHNLLLLKHIDKLAETGYRVVVGSSRKRFIGQITNVQKADERLMGTAATVVLSVIKGADVFRVHDVREIKQVLKMTNAVINEN
jgi:dihydropteroate synthase